MVHRTDIAGRSTGQASLGRNGMCRRALNGLLYEFQSPAGDSATGSRRPFDRSHAAHPELLTL